MSLPVQPIFLFADSQLLFWRKEGRPFLARAREGIDAGRPKAAYVGASNGDQPDFYQLFLAAMEGVGITDCRMIPAAPSEEDQAFFEEADLILLSGGDVWRGWRAFKKSGLTRKLIERYYGGAVVMGVSAGAVQLGLHGWHEDGEESGEDGPELFECWKLVPALVDVHQEPEWTRLETCLAKAGGEVMGLGIPSGGGAIVHQDLTVEPVRRSLVEYSRGEDGVLQQSLVFP